MVDYSAPWWRNFRDGSAARVGKKQGVVRGAWSVVVLAGLVALLVHGCVDSVDRTVELDERAARRSQAMAAEFHSHVAFFDRHGSADPATMAAAVLAADPDLRPLMAAVAVVESNGNPQAVGDGGRSCGAWQVQGAHWGEVSGDAVEQARQAELILMELVDAVEHRGSLRWSSALARYNGGHTPPGVSYRYARRVLDLAWQNAMGGLL